MSTRISPTRLVLSAVCLPLALGFLAPNDLDQRWARLSAYGNRVVTTVFAAREAKAEGDDSAYASYEETIGVLRRDYTGATLDQKRVRDITFAGIRGMLYTLNDPFTSFLDPSEWAQMQQTTRGEFEGIGAVLEPFGQDVRVVRPIAGSPAFAAGLKAGDIIFSVGIHDARTGALLKTTPTLGKNINDVVALIKGPKGTVVTVSVMRKGHTKPLKFVMRRRRVETPTVEYWMVDDRNKIGQVLLREFNEKSASQFDHAVAALQKRGMRSLIFDLRYNPGGLLDVAVDIGSRFVERNQTVVSIQEKSGPRRFRVRSARASQLKYPLVVLVNKSSASASEIVAGAIQDYGVGKLVGEHTFGKGLVQTLFPLSDGSALRLTTAKYFTPSGRDISNKYDDEHRPLFGTGGVKPDVKVTQPESWEDVQDFGDKKNDKQLQAAIELLRKGTVAHNAQAAQ